MSRLLPAGLAMLILYGSLFPFEFDAPASTLDELMLLLSRWDATSRGDIIGNVVLFLPLGLVGGLRIGRVDHRVLSGVLFLIAALALATASQLAQIYLPSRSPALSDIVWNMVGTAAGLGLGVAGAKRLVQGPGQPWSSAGTILPCLLVALWAGAEVLPAIPSFDLQLVKDNLKPLLAPELNLPRVFFHASGVMLAMVLAPALPWAPRPQYVGQALVTVVIAAKVLGVRAGLDVSALTGMVGGYALAATCASRDWGWNTALLLGILLLTTTLSGLLPFELRTTPGDVKWIPFAGWLEGSMLDNSRSLARSLFLYGGILGLVTLSGGHVLGSTAVLAAWVAAIEACQLWLVGRGADVSEPLLVIILGAFLRSIRRSTTVADARRRIAAAGPTSLPVSAPAAWQPVRWLLALGVAWVAINTAIALGLRVPQVPYNVRELFLFDGSLAAIAVFALALLWFGASAPVVARYVTYSRHRLVAWPAAGFSAAMIALLLLCASVTQESIGDITGSNNLDWVVGEKGSWGETAKAMFVALNAERWHALIERPVRFASLYFTPLIFLAIAWALLGDRWDRLDARTAAALVLSALPWLWLAKAITHDWSSTDNLNELIAADGEWGIGGGGYLYVLLLLISLQAVALANLRREWHNVGAALGVLLGLVPLGWWLLNLGLEPHIKKYGLDFSGVQFLLGPDRENTLLPSVLFGRWAAVQTGAAVVLAAGLRLGVALSQLRRNAASSMPPPGVPAG